MMYRVLSIDVFRGITMFLMLWVNDFWTLKSIPKFLRHAVAGEDYLGFSDLIFPWFLFAIGLSIPFAFENRTLKLEKQYMLLKHIVFRTISLLTMGLFHMNMEMYNHETTILPKPIFVIIVTMAFFMIWIDYSKITLEKKMLFKIMPYLGLIILGLILFFYDGQDYDGNAIGFSIHWWGILGLIGWVYLIVGIIYFVFKKSIISVIGAFFICLLLNVASSSGIPYNIFSWQSVNWIPGSGGLQALAFGGVITSLCLMHFKSKENITKLYAILLGMGIISLISGLFLRKYFIISKISGTPSWILISLSSALILFVFLHWLVDIRRKMKWYAPLAIAGTSTLTCYLIPYFYYSFRSIIDLQLPIILISGNIGLLKSFFYSFIIIAIVWGLERINIKLKI